MQKIAVTGCASRFAKVLLPLLEADPNIEQIIGIDLVPPTGTSSKLVFHKQDIRDPGMKEMLAGCDTLVHLAFIVGRPYSMPLAEAASINLGRPCNVSTAPPQPHVPNLLLTTPTPPHIPYPSTPH